MTAPETRAADEPGKAPADSPASRAVEPETIPAAAPTALSSIRSAIVRWLNGATGSRQGRSSDELAQDRTDLAATRTLLAADRTLMAWLRTSLSMQTFGFTIYKILQAFQQTGGILPKADTPRNVGLILTGMATVAMVIGTIEYWATLKDLRAFRPIPTLRPPLVMAVLMSLSGLTLFFSIITKIF